MMRGGVREVAWQLELFTIQGRDVCRPDARDISCHALHLAADENYLRILSKSVILKLHRVKHFNQKSKIFTDRLLYA